MTSTTLIPNTDADGTSIDLSTIDVDAALQRGRQLRSQAFTSALKSLFRGHRAERTERKDGFSPDCTAAA